MQTFQSCETNVACDLWHLIAKIFIKYFTHHTDDVDLLFILLKALSTRFIPDFQVNKKYKYRTDFVCFLSNL